MQKKRVPDLKQRSTRRLLAVKRALILSRACEQPSLVALVGSLHLGAIIDAELARAGLLDLSFTLAMIDLGPEVLERRSDRASLGFDLPTFREDHLPLDARPLLVFLVAHRLTSWLVRRSVRHSGHDLTIRPDSTST